MQSHRQSLWSYPKDESRASGKRAKKWWWFARQLWKSSPANNDKGRSAACSSCLSQQNAAGHAAASLVGREGLPGPDSERSDHQIEDQRDQVRFFAEYNVQVIGSSENRP